VLENMRASRGRCIRTRGGSLENEEEWMKNEIAVVAALTTVWWVTTARAQPPGASDKPAATGKAVGQAAAPGSGAPGQAPRPAPENDVIKRSTGTWSCEGTGKGPDGQEMKYKSTWTVKPTLGGHWYAIVYKRSRSGPMPAFEGNATVGYKVADKKYSFVGFDNVGGWVDLSSSDGGVYTGEGAPMGNRSAVKFTFTPGKDKKGQESDRLFDVTLDLGVLGSSESCKK
jgi:Protein of unknown function (DUF1579)